MARFMNNQNGDPGAVESGLNIHKPRHEDFDDDGKPKRTGNLWTASAHIITAVIGSGVLSLAWGVAQLGWIAGVITLLMFSFITFYCSSLQADCYRSADGKRNYTYREVVKSNLGYRMFIACAVVQYVNLSGTIIGYTITASISMTAIEKAGCFHYKGHDHDCNVSHNPYMIGLGLLELFLSQIPNFHNLSFLSAIAAVMSFGYSTIGVGLALYRVISGNGGRTTLTGVEIGSVILGSEITAADKVMRMFRAFGCIAFAFTYSQILVEIQDTLRANPPENKVMKQANAVGVSTTTIFYMMCGCFGYAAFGNEAPGNLLTGFGFYEPFWLVDLGNACIVLHLIGAYQVFAQPVFSAVEVAAAEKWPKSKLVNEEYMIRLGGGDKLMFRINFLRLIWRSLFVCMGTLIAMVFPFFNDVLALLGACGYWPLTVYFPIQMHIAKYKIRRWTMKWIGLQLINMLCFCVALAAVCGSIQGLSKALKVYKPFHVRA